MTGMSLAASIIIVTYHSSSHIDACLRSALSQEADFPYEIIVVDNASADDTVARVRAHGPAARLIACEENLGFAGGVNRGVAAAQGDRIALLNPDAEARPDWLRRIIAPLDDSGVGVAGGKVLNFDGRIQSVGGTLDSRLLLPAYRGEGEADQGQYDASIDVWSAHGAAMAFRRNVWDALGGFDESYFPAYLEESDFCERARRAGYRVIAAPTAIVQHHESTTTGKGSPQFLYYFLRNRLRYATKWLGWPALWRDFRRAEHGRLTEVGLLERRVARLVYEAGVPPDRRLAASERAAVLNAGHQLREGRLPADGFDDLIRLIDEAERESVHHETTFRSSVPLLAGLRTRWNNIATRWYVRPNLDQQTRYNLALARAARLMSEQLAARAAADALDRALLAWRIESPAVNA